MTTKVTYTVDDETVAQVEQLARRLRIPRSRVVREAVAAYAAGVSRLTDAERDRLLRSLDELMRRPPTRSVAAVERELAALRAARKAGGRRSPVPL
jgi:predicted transcriptional regulator